MTDSKENYKLDLGSERVKLQTYLDRSCVPYKTVLRLTENYQGLLPLFGCLVHRPFPQIHNYSFDIQLLSRRRYRTYEGLLLKFF